MRDKPQQIQQWLEMADKIFDKIAGEDIQILCPERTQYFLLALLLNELTEQNVQ